MLSQTFGPEINDLILNGKHLMEHFQKYHNQYNRPTEEGGILEQGESGLKFLIDQSVDLSLEAGKENKVMPKICVQIYGKRDSPQGILLTQLKTSKDYPDCVLIKLCENMNILTNNLIQKYSKNGQKKQ